MAETMRSKMKLLTVLILCMSFGMASAETTLIKAEQLTVTLSNQGEIIGITLSDGVHRSAKYPKSNKSQQKNGPWVHNDRRRATNSPTRSVFAQKSLENPERAVRISVGGYVCELVESEEGACGLWLLRIRLALRY